MSVQTKAILALKAFSNSFLVWATPSPTCLSNALLLKRCAFNGSTLEGPYRPYKALKTLLRALKGLIRFAFWSRPNNCFLFLWNPIKFSILKCLESNKIKYIRLLESNKIFNKHKNYGFLNPLIHPPDVFVFKIFQISLAFYTIYRRPTY